MVPARRASSSGKGAAGAKGEDDEAKMDSKPASSASSATSSSANKGPKAVHKHPLSKCPCCPNIFLPQGLFGHYARVHSGQLCPFSFCPDVDDGEKDRGLVADSHDGCFLTRPNAVGPGDGRIKRSGSSGMDSAGPKRRVGRPRRSSAESEYNDEEEQEDDASEASTRVGTSEEIS